MINMGMKLAEICDLDNRPFHIKQSEINRINKANDLNDHDGDRSFDSESEQSFNITKNKIDSKNDKKSTSQLKRRKGAKETSSNLIKPRNYPFYYKIKRNLYVMQ